MGNAARGEASFTLIASGTMVATQDSYGTFKPAQEGHSRRIMLGLIFGVALVAVGCIATVLVSAAGTETQELAFDKYGLPIRNKKVASSLDSDFAALSTNPHGWHQSEYKDHGFKPKESVHKAELWSTPKSMKVHKKTWKDVLNGQSDPDAPPPPPKAIVMGEQQSKAWKNMLMTSPYALKTVKFGNIDGPEAIWSSKVSGSAAKEIKNQ